MYVIRIGQLWYGGFNNYNTITGGSSVSMLYEWHSACVFRKFRDAKYRAKQIGGTVMYLPRPQEVVEDENGEDVEQSDN